MYVQGKKKVKTKKGKKKNRNMLEALTPQNGEQ